MGTCHTQDPLFWRFVYQHRNGSTYLCLVKLLPEDTGVIVMLKLRTEYFRVKGQFLGRLSKFWVLTVEAGLLCQVVIRFAISSHIRYVQFTYTVTEQHHGYRSSTKTSPRHSFKSENRHRAHNSHQLPFSSIWGPSICGEERKVFSQSRNSYMRKRYIHYSDYAITQWVR